MGALVTERGADAGSRDPVASRAGDAFDETVGAQPAQVVGHGPRRPSGRRDAEQRHQIARSARPSSQSRRRRLREHTRWKCVVNAEGRA